MSQALTGLEFFCFAFLDNILTYSTSWKEYVQHLESVLSHLKVANLKHKLSKYQFFKQHLPFLGHLISEQGIQPLLDKILTITNLAVPKNTDELVIY